MRSLSETLSAHTIPGVNIMNPSSPPPSAFERRISERFEVLGSGTHTPRNLNDPESDFSEP